MSKRPETLEDFLPLSATAFHILFTLVEGPKHGYAIRQDVEDETDGSIVIHIGSLYNHIRRLQKIGLITESEDRPPSEIDDSRRRYYRLTATGRKALQAEADRVRKLVVLLEKKNFLGSL